MNPVYGPDGKVTAWLFSDVLYSLNGTPVAYLSGENVLNFSGAHCGVLKNLFFRDHHGDVVGFLKGASGGPKLPVPLPPPPAPMKGLAPMRPPAPMSPVQAMATYNWSRLAWQQFVLPPSA